MVVPSTVAPDHRVVGARGTLSANTLVTAARRLSAVPMPRGSGVRSTSSAAFAPASEPAWESSVFETPSRTTSTARPPGFSDASSAIASSLRVCRMPLSHTPATHDAGCSR